jgi:hypothetical protein
MPFYLRKSVSAGPFRFDFSKSGIGASVGVQGLRVGTGPRGHYVHAGWGGIHYRSTIGKAGQSRRDLAPRAQRSPDLISYSEPNVEMIPVDSGNVLEMRDERFSNLLDKINSKQRQLAMATMLDGEERFLAC